MRVGGTGTARVGWVGLGWAGSVLCAFMPPCANHQRKFVCAVVRNPARQGGTNRVLTDIKGVDVSALENT